MPSPSWTSTWTGSAEHFNCHNPERRVQPRSALCLHLPQRRSSPGLRVFRPSDTPPPGLGSALPRTPPHGSHSSIARLTSPGSSQGAQGPRSPHSPAPERGVPIYDLDFVVRGEEISRWKSPSWERMNLELRKCSKLMCSRIMYLLLAQNNAPG